MESCVRKKPANALPKNSYCRAGLAVNGMFTAPEMAAEILETGFATPGPAPIRCEERPPRVSSLLV